MTYRVNEIFYSLQGEGIRAGCPSVFLRFSGCNLQCSKEQEGFDCDTEFVSGVDMTIEQILQRIDQISEGCDWVVLTGGEPLLQLDQPLCSALKSAGYNLALETNGTINPDSEVLKSLDWITCSPKVAEHCVRLERCDELKYVRGYGQGIPKPKLQCVNKLISPAFDANTLLPETLIWCIDLVQNNPEWRLSVQQHKMWQVR